MTRLINRIANTTAVVVLLAVSVILFQKPYYNWDMFPYMAIASFDGSEWFATTHKFVYKEAAANMSAHDFEAISLRQPELMNDPIAFQGILHYFKIKPGYNLVVGFLHACGVKLLTATYLPSVLSYFLIGVMMLFWMQRIVPPPYSAMITLVFMASPFLVSTARYSSPDMLCATICFAAFFILLEYAVVPGLLVLLVAITVRPDAAILLLSTTVALFRNRDLSIKQTLLFLLAGIALTLVVVGGVDILIEFLFTTSSYSRSWSPNVMLSNYFNGLAEGISSLQHSLVFMFSLIAIAILYLQRASFDRWSWLISAALASIAIRYLLHPVMEDRFVIPCYLLIIMGLCNTLGKRLMPPLPEKNYLA